jgi:hypothetical protein
MLRRDNSPYIQQFAPKAPQLGVSKIRITRKKQYLGEDRASQDASAGVISWNDKTAVCRAFRSGFAC